MRYRSSTFVPSTPRSLSRGFGLVELMVSISIMTLVSTVILVKNRSFNNALLLRNQAYEIAFSLRQAQLTAVSSNATETSTRRPQYGIHITTSSSTYRMFRDNGNNQNWFDSLDTVIPAGVAETIDSRYEVKDIVNAAGTSLGVSALSITFVRPNFDALFYSGASTQITGPVYLKIGPKDSTGYSAAPFRLVEITGTGQISVK